MANPHFQCDWAMWWLREDIIATGMADKNQPPAFLFSEDPEATWPEKMKAAGKITIDVYDD